MFAARALRIAVRRLPRVRGRGRIERLIERFYGNRSEPILCRTNTGEMMRVHPQDGGPDQYVWRSGVYEPSTSALLRRVLRPDDVFFDIGAHVGYYTCLVGRRVPRGHVVALEPFEQSFERLNANISANDLQNVTTLRRAAWNRSDESIRLDGVPGEASPSMQATPAEGEVEGVPTAETIAIDDLVEQVQMQPTFIKMDIEGSEPLALEGAAETLTEHKPVLIVEYNEETAARMGFSAPEIFRGLRERYGYRLFSHEAGRRGTRPDLAKLGDDLDVEPSENVICIPPAELEHRDWPIV